MVCVDVIECFCCFRVFGGWEIGGMSVFFGVDVVVFLIEDEVWCICVDFFIFGIEVNGYFFVYFDLGVIL